VTGVQKCALPIWGLGARGLALRAGLISALVALTLLAPGSFTLTGLKESSGAIETVKKGLN